MALELSVHQRRFKAAVKVMRNLPADGVFVPSDDMLIRFHSFHQQATAGVCSGRKPCGRDSLSEAEWEAWRALGDMSKEDAMKAYVEEILLIVEMIPVTEEVSDLLDVLELFYEVVEDEDGDDETISKPAMATLSGRREVWRGNSADEDEDDEEDDDMEEHDVDDDDDDEDGGDVSVAARRCDEPVSEVCGDSEGSESSRAASAQVKRPEEREGDTKDESVSQEKEPQGAALPPLCTAAHGAVQSVVLSVGRGGHVSRHSAAAPMPHDSTDGARVGADPLDTQIMLALSRLQDDLRSVLDTLNILEARAVAQVERLALRPDRHSAKARLPVRPSAVSQISVAFLLVWPFVAHVLVRLYLKKKIKASRLTCAAFSPSGPGL